MGRAWEIDAHTFRILWAHFSHKIPILWYTSSHGKCMHFLINLPIIWEKTVKIIEWGKFGKLGPLTKPIVCGEPGKLVLILFP